ncbi:MAG: hypothetical protein AAFZ15_22855 [Bacteroidota bacterium]
MENNFEKNIKNTFDQFSPQLDHDEIWENIEPHLKKKKKKRFIIWLLFGGLGLGFLFLFNQQKANTDIIDKTVDKKETIHTEPQPAEKLITENNTEKPVDTKKENPAINYNIENTKNNNGLALQEPIISPVPKEVILPKQNLGELKTVKTEKKEKTTDHEKIISSEKNTDLTDQKEIIGPEIKNEISVIKDEKNELTEELMQGLSEEVENPTTKKIKSKSDEKEKAKKPKKKRIKPRGKTWRSYYLLSAAPMLRYKHYKDQISSSQSAYKKARKDTEKPLEAFSINMGLQFQNNHGFFITTGIEYQQINEKFERTTVSEITEVRDGLLTVTENANGQIINSTSGPKEVVTRIEQTDRIYNNYRFVNIPIGIGKVWNNKNRGFQLSGGLDYNLSFVMDGALLNEENEIVQFRRNRFSTNYDATFKRSSGLGLWLSGGYFQMLGPRLQGILSPRLQMPFTAVTKSDERLNTRFFRLNLDVGIRYLLKNKKDEKQETEWSK